MLLATKLSIPQKHSHLVARPRLFSILDQSLHKKLTLISAPAGFGKTTLVTEWLANLEKQDKERGRQGDKGTKPLLVPLSPPLLVPLSPPLLILLLLGFRWMKMITIRFASSVMSLRP